MYSLPDDKMIKNDVWNGTIPDTNNWLVKEYVGGFKLLVSCIVGGKLFI